jgi:hypothetical protein
MRCLFCKGDSSGSQSVEHGIPEALGNTTFILPRGIVCDRCNNYFAVKVERPLLEDGWLRDMRARQGVPSKRKRLLPVNGHLQDTDISIVGFRVAPDKVAFGLSESNARPITRGELATSANRLFIHDESLPIDRRLFSRLIAKIALELVAQRIHHVPEWETFAIDHPQFDPIREYARFGRGPNWPVFSRRIYEEEATIILPNGEQHQVLHEGDFLLTPENHGYAVICIFGVEHAINLTEPSVASYRRWLKKHDGQSPLYAGAETPR